MTSTSSALIRRANSKARLRLSTGLSSAVIALWLLTPAAARASDDCTSTAGVITCPASGGSYPAGITYAIPAAAPVQDLTIALGDGYALRTTADNATGISLSNASGGAITVAAGSGSIIVSGSGAAGISAVAPDAQSTGDLTIVAGDVTTHGYRADGIHVNANYGGTGSISIDAGHVLTTGEASVGISAAATHGDVAITAASVNTTGYGSGAIYAATYSGNTTVNVGSVETSGTAGRGISAYSGGTTTVTAGSITTTGAGTSPDGDGSGIIARGTAVHVDVGSISTAGDYGSGIYAGTSFAYDTGQAVRDITINAGSVATAGFSADGIHIQNYTEGGSTNVHVGSVSTQGDYSWGVYARSQYGVVAIDAGSVSTQGDGGTGVFVKNYDGSQTVINAGSVVTHGSYANAIDALGVNGAVTINAGGVSTAGAESYGIHAVSIYNQVGVTVDTVKTEGGHALGIYAGSVYGETQIDIGSITTSGDSSTGIEAIGVFGNVGVTVQNAVTTGNTSAAVYAHNQYGAVTVHAGSVATSGYFSAGIKAQSPEGNVVVAAGQVKTSGDSATGIIARSIYGDVSVGADSVATNGVNSAGILASSLEGNVTVKAGSVTTTGGAAGLLTVSYGGNDVVLVNSVETRGNYATGLGAQAAGKVTVVAGTVSTHGNYAAGLRSFSTNGDVIVSAGTVSTKGDSSQAISARAPIGDVTLTVDKVTTSGRQSGAIYAAGASKITITAGAVETAGSDAHGIHAVTSDSSGLGLGGLIAIKSNGVTTSGTNATAIYASGGTPATAVSIEVGQVGTAGDHAIGVDAASTSGTVAVKAGKVSTAGDTATGLAAHTETGDISVVANSVTTVGDASHAIDVRAGSGTISVIAREIGTRGHAADGVVANNATGTVNVLTNLVATTGDGSRGIVAAGRALSLDTGDTSSAKSTAIALQGQDSATLTIRGAANGGIDGVRLQALSAQMTIARGASVSGAVNGVMIDASSYAGPAVPAAAIPAPHGASILNGGTITGGTGYAITVINGPATVTNAGTLSGALKFADGDDLVTNSGAFLIARDSDFGAGNDRFVNSGVVRVLAGTSQSGMVRLLGLERFENNAGLIELRNGHVGDTLVLPGGYAGTGGAKLGLDISFGATRTSDQLVVQGAATGATAIVLANIGPAQATLTATPIALVKVGAGSSPDAFTLDEASRSIGFVQYGLRFERASGSYALTGVSGAPVHRLARAGEAAQNVWLRSADAVTGHMTALRDGEWAGTDTGKLWGQAQGGTDRRNGSGVLTSPNGNAGTYDATYRQDYYGFQLGKDLYGKTTGHGGVVLGVTGGYLSSTLHQSGDGLSFDAVNAGGYATVSAGRFFASALAKYDHYWVKASSPALDYQNRLQGSSWGASAEAGFRLGSERLFAEPVASIAWTRTGLDDLQVLGNGFAFDAASGLRGKAGLRGGALLAVTGSAKALVYASSQVVHEFAGTDGLTFTSGNASDHVLNDRLGTYGEGRLGVNLLTQGPVSAYVEGTAHIGRSYRGGGGRVGVLIRF